MVGPHIPSSVFTPARADAKDACPSPRVPYLNPSTNETTCELCHASCASGSCAGIDATQCLACPSTSYLVARDYGYIDFLKRYAASGTCNAGAGPRVMTGAWCTALWLAWGCRDARADVAGKPAACASWRCAGSGTGAHGQATGATYLVTVPS